jgi:hypothetical protein
MFSQDATPGTVPRFLTAAATIATLGAAVLSLSLGVWLCGSGFEHIRGADAAVILTVQKALLGTPILTDPADRPYATTQYSPLIYVIDFGLAKAMGVQADELVRLSGICRGVSLAALLLLVATLTFGLRRFLGVGWAMAATMGGYSFVVFSPWGYVARPDSLQSLFTALTVLIVATAADRSETEGLWLFCLAGITSIASLYSKQNGIQAAAVLFGFLLLHRWWRAMFWSAATMLATVVALWIAAPPIVGSAWRQNLIGGIDN